jgi:phage-related protein
MKKIKIKDEFNLFRDSSTNAIVNTDMQSYNNYLSSKKTKEEESKKIQNIENEITSIKGDLNEIKDLLRNLSK